MCLSVKISKECVGNKILVENDWSWDMRQTLSPIHSVFEDSVYDSGREKIWGIYDIWTNVRTYGKKRALKLF